MISAWASKNRMVLGQLKTEQKSNEITAIPNLLNLLDISGCIITIDALGTQKKIAEAIKKKERIICSLSKITKRHSAPMLLNF